MDNRQTPLIRKLAAFAPLSEKALDALREAADERTVKGGQYLVRFGETADTLYLVLSGRFHVGLPDGQIIAEIGTGEPIGELAFFAGGQRTADIIAARDSTVLELTRDAYTKVTSEHREVIDSILLDTTKRLVRTTANRGAPRTTPGSVLTILPAGDVSLSETFIERLAEALAKYTHARVLRAADKPPELSLDGGAFGQWLAELEVSCDRIVLVAGLDDAWNRAIVRNGDDVVFVAPLAHGNAFLSPLETYANTVFRRQNRRLVLWRDDSDQPIQGTARWIDNREVHIHHHLALTSTADFERVARFISRCANGIVLAGGGALGCAHIGVMEALLESGIPIDYFAGTSVGAAMGGALARGITPQDLLFQMQDMFVTHKAMKRPTIPVHSFLDPRVFDEQLRTRFGTQDIADLPFNFFAVSTNLSLNNLKVHRRGALWEAVRASASLPTILPPFITPEGEVLIDGGVLDNVPVDVMRASKAGPNVVVALRPEPGEAWRVKASYDDIRTPWRIARDFILRRKPAEAFPSLIEVMSRAMVVTSEGAVEDALSRADVLLIPPIPEDMQILDWHRGAEIAKAAREFTLRAVEEREGLAAMKAK